MDLIKNYNFINKTINFFNKINNSINKIKKFNINNLINERNKLVSKIRNYIQIDNISIKEARKSVKLIII